MKVFKMRNSECGQWTYIESLPMLNSLLKADMEELNYFDAPYSIQVEIEIVEMSEEDFNDLPESEGC